MALVLIETWLHLDVNESDAANASRVDWFDAASGVDLRRAFKDGVRVHWRPNSAEDPFSIVLKGTPSNVFFSTSAYFVNGNT